MYPVTLANDVPDVEGLSQPMAARGRYEAARGLPRFGASTLIPSRHAANNPLGILSPRLPCQLLGGLAWTNSPRVAQALRREQEWTRPDQRELRKAPDVLRKLECERPASWRDRIEEF